MWNFHKALAPAQFFAHYQHCGFSSGLAAYTCGIFAEPVRQPEFLPTTSVVDFSSGLAAYLCEFSQSPGADPDIFTHSLSS